MSSSKFTRQISKLLRDYNDKGGDPRLAYDVLQNFANYMAEKAATQSPTALVERKQELDVWSMPDANTEEIEKGLKEINNL